MTTRTYTPITKDNLLSFPIGTQVRFNYGPMHGSENGLIVDFASDRWGFHLIAETDDGEKKTIEGFTTAGIGVYLI